MAQRFSIVFITAPKGGPAKKIAHAVLKDRLAACVNIVPAIESHYWWKGKLESSRESLLVVKTRRSLLKRLEARVRAVHPYEVPEIISVDLAGGNAPYLAWLAKETR